MAKFFSVFSPYFILLCLIISLPACGDSPTYQQEVIFSGPTMGTTYTIKIHVPDKTTDRSTIAATINYRLEEINSQMSTYVDTSALSLFNQSRTQDWYNIPFNLYVVIEEALKINKLSDGAFDITIGHIVNLWGFGPTALASTIPDESVINPMLNKVGSKYIHLYKEPYAIKKDKPDLYIDLSAIAKGYAVDVIADSLDNLSLNNYMVEIGGEIKTKGVNSNNKIWSIGIEKPLDDQRSVQTVITLNNTGMATSGDYRNYFEKNGIRYSHTIDPSTGKPVTHKLASVTVLDPSAMTADAMATALMVLGPEHGLKLALKENLATLFIIHEKDNFIEIMTPQFEQVVANSR